MKTKLNVKGMTCASCAAHVEKAACKVEGAQNVAVNLMTNTLVLDTPNDEVLNSVIAAVEQAGYAASRAVNENNKPEVNTLANEADAMKHRLIVSIVFFIPLMYLAMGHMIGLPLPSIMHGEANLMINALTQFLLALPVIIANKKYFTVGFRMLLRRSPNMDSLIAIGSSAALIYGIYALYQMAYGYGHFDMVLVEDSFMALYFESSATILTLVTLGKYLEARSKGKTGDAIKKLIALQPNAATVIRDGKEQVLPIESIELDDVLVIRPGESIPVDGIVVEGESTCDESAVTGESIPADKVQGDRVIAGSINQTGRLLIRAKTVGDDTTLSKIIQLVEDATATKAPIAVLADKISYVFVPVVICIAIITAIVWLAVGETFNHALMMAISVLVISCPCALGLATPVAIMVGMGQGAKKGILIKSAEALQTMQQVNTVVLDKTGTITEGKPSVQKITGDDDLLQIAASLEQYSEHPYAKAIVSAYDGTLLACNAFHAIVGRGVKGVIDGEECLGGNAVFLSENGFKVDESNDMGTTLLFTKGSRMLGHIAISDSEKPTSKLAIAQMRHNGIEVIMLTGDSRKTADSIAQSVGVTRAIAEVLPDEKEHVIQELILQGKTVAMVGDGINDAPSLARAQVGIAVGAGTDIAIESADVVLVKNDLNDVVTAMALSKRVMRNIKQNLFWAFFYNAIGIPLAAGVFYPLLGWQLSPMFAAFAMSMSSVFVVGNALRLNRFSAVENERMDNGMEKTIHVEGMSCNHCKASVEKALTQISGVTECEVDLKKKTATVKLQEDVSIDTLFTAVKEAGFEPSVQPEKKGWFGHAGRS